MEKMTYQSSIDEVYVIHYVAKSTKRTWNVCGLLKDIIFYNQKNGGELKDTVISTGFLRVTLDHEGKTSPKDSQDDKRPSKFRRLLTGDKPLDQAERLIKEWFNLCRVCSVYPIAEKVRALRENDLIICDPIVENGKIANPKSVKLVSINQSETGSERVFVPNLPENFPGCPIAQALLGIHRRNTISPFTFFKIR